MTWERTSGPLTEKELTAEEAAMLRAIKKAFGKVRFHFGSQMLAVGKDGQQQLLYTAVIVVLTNGKRKYAIWAPDDPRLTKLTYAQAHCTCGGKGCAGPVLSALEATLQDDFSAFMQPTNKVN
jgi:hypothetical protein